MRVTKSIEKLMLEDDELAKYIEDSYAFFNTQHRNSLYFNYKDEVIFLITTVGHPSYAQVTLSIIQHPDVPMYYYSVSEL